MMCCLSLFFESIFKGTVSGDGYFFKGLNIIFSTSCVCADGFQGFYLLL
jgi:hypothetical protein